MNERPNILILHADQLRYDGLGCDGNPHARTPHIDAIAAEGSVFTRHIVANPVCMPSRASLATGLYPSGHNVWGNGVCLPRQGDIGPAGAWPQPPGLPPATFADVFAAAGYDTASFGKLHFTSNRAPLEYGGAENWSLMDAGGLRGWHGPYYGFQHVEMTKGHAEEPCESGHYADWLEANHPATRAAARGPKNSAAYPLPGRRDLYASPVPSEQHCSRWLADRFGGWLADRPAGRPFFAFVGFPDPHHAFTPSHDLAEIFRDAPVREPSDPTGAGWQRSLTIYDDRFRLTWWPACGTVELFDHHGDPDEVCDLGGSGHPDEARLLAELKERQLRIDNPMLGKVGAW